MQQKLQQIGESRYFRDGGRAASDAAKAEQRNWYGVILVSLCTIRLLLLWLRVCLSVLSLLYRSNFT